MQCAYGLPSCDWSRQRASFFYWGVYTVAGLHRFDEMDGIIQYATGLLAFLLAIVATVLFLIAWKRS